MNNHCINIHNIIIYFHDEQNVSKVVVLIPITTSYSQQRREHYENSTY